MALLDIIVTHFDEPWEVGKPFFDMIEHQRCFNRSAVNIVLIQDGEQTALPWHELFAEYSYKINVITIPHSGMAEARNEGIRRTNSDWIMFCDFDDMFTSVNSVPMFSNVLPLDVCDVIWGPYYKEERYDNDHNYVNEVNEGDFTSVVCKIFRRKALEENGLWFDGTLPLFTDYIFGVLLLNVIPPFRITRLTAPFFTYQKTLREGSMRSGLNNAEEMNNQTFERNMIILKELKRRGKKKDFANLVVKTLCDEYKAVAEIGHPDTYHVDMSKISRFYIENKDVFYSVSKATAEVIMNESETEKMSVIQRMYNMFGKEYDFINIESNFTEWLNKLEYYKKEDVEECDPDIIDITKPIIALNPNEYSMKDESGAIDNHSDSKKHVAVYCGTFNTYLNMLTSAKSLLNTTPMDKIYFIIEDDKFPYEIPDIIECINIKNNPILKQLDPNGPNYNSSWTYMCMIRSLFPQMFPQYDKVISFDIDTIIQEDISNLWDLDMSDYYIAGVCEPERQKYYIDFYINFGVVMMNLKKLRDDGKDKEIIDSLNTMKHGCPEQDAFNMLCAGHILPIAADYNVTLFSHITGDPEKEIILHYAGLKYWRHFEPVKKLTGTAWDIIMKKQGEMHG